MCVCVCVSSTKGQETWLASLSCFGRNFIIRPRNRRHFVHYLQLELHSSHCPLHCSRQRERVSSIASTTFSILCPPLFVEFSNLNSLLLLSLKLSGGVRSSWKILRRCLKILWWLGWDFWDFLRFFFWAASNDRLWVKRETFPFNWSSERLIQDSCGYFFFGGSAKSFHSSLGINARQKYSLGIDEGFL